MNNNTTANTTVTNKIPSFEEIKRIGFDYAVEDNKGKEEISEEEVKTLTESILELVKELGKNTLKVIKYSDDPINKFFGVCEEFERLAPESKRILDVKRKLYVFTSTHGKLGTVVGVLTTIIRAVVRLVLDGIKLLFKVVVAVIVALANAGYRIVKEVKGQFSPYTSQKEARSKGGDKKSEKELLSKIEALEEELKLANAARQ